MKAKDIDKEVINQTAKYAAQSCYMNKTKELSDAIDRNYTYATSMINIDWMTFKNIVKPIAEEILNNYIENGIEFPDGVFKH